MFKKILLAFAALLAVFLVVVAFQPAAYRVVRTATISAPPAAVFAHVNDLRRWQAWSPWEKLDPAMKRTFAGAASGAGASYGWEGNSDVGTGRMTITESRPAELVRIKLEFIKPMAGMSMTDFTFKPQGNQTAVSWEMTGENNFIAKAICLFMDMEKMLGGQFEQGLAALKAVAETGKASS
jgi:uncharacterized protein YndB with AHSA1/START domain